MDVLDVGCGTGRSQAIYADFARRYVGIDLSEHELIAGRTRQPELAWVRGDGCMLPFATERFDAVCFSAVLHHIPDFSPALREAIRVLRPGGHVFAFDPNLLNPAMALFRCPRSPLYSQNGVSPNERPLTPDHLRRAFAAAGIVDIQQRGQADMPYRAVAPKLLNAFLSLYNFGDWLMGAVATGPDFFGAAGDHLRKETLAINTKGRGRVNDPAAGSESDATTFHE